MTSTKTSRLAAALRALIFIAALFLVGAGVVLAAARPGSTRGQAQEAPAEQQPRAQDGDLQTDLGARRGQEPGELPEGDELGRSTPRGTIEGFLSATRAGELRRASRYLDFSLLPELGAAERLRYARELRLVLDRHLEIDPANFSALEEGDLEDDLPRSDIVGSVNTPEGTHTLFLQRRPLAEEGPGRRELIWTFSPETVLLVPELYEVRGYGVIEDLLPSYFFEMRFLALELWQWVGLLALVLAASFVGLFLSMAILRILYWIAGRSAREWPRMIVDALAGPLRLAASLWLFYIGVAALLFLAAPAMGFVGRTVEILTLLAFTWLALRLVDVGANLIRDHFTERGVLAVRTLVPMGVRITKVFVVFVALLSLVHNLGFNVASILAGLGIGGLAVALALQKPLENLFSGIMVILDQPVKVGDFCRVGDHMGTVEDIGLRSTRLRTLDRTLLSIPNADFAAARVESFAARDKIRLYHVLSFGYDTTPDQLRYVLTRIRELLHAHPKTDPDPCRARFIRYGAHSLDVELFLFIKTTDINEFLAIQEDIFLRIWDAVEESGAYFAFPSQTLYLGRDAGRDPERTQAAEERVRSWREAGELPFPALSPERIAEIDDTLPWPPEGAPRPPEAAAPATSSTPAGRGNKKGGWRS